MTNTQHTPGPWRVEGMLTHRVKPGHIISHGMNEYRDGPEGYVCDTLGTTPADARLIAAAPELLAALEHIEWAVTGFGDFEAQYPEEVAAARAAIAKATGQ